MAFIGPFSKRLVLAARRLVLMVVDVSGRA